MNSRHRAAAFVGMLAIMLAACAGGGPTASTPEATQTEGVADTGSLLDPASDDPVDPAVPAGNRSASVPGSGASGTPTTSTGKKIRPPKVDPDYPGEIGVSDTTIKLGFIYPKSGPYQALTQEFEPAARAAMQSINDAGGIHGRFLEFVGADDGYNNASTALASAKSLADQVFGFSTLGILSGSVVSPYADEHSIPMIVGNVDRGTAINLKSVFTTSTYLETSARILPSFIRNRLKQDGKHIGVLYQTTPQIAVIREHFREAAADWGMEVLLEQGIDERPASCTNEMTNLDNAGATIVLMFTSPVPAIQCLKDARIIGYDPIITGVGPSFNFEITNTASGGLTEGISVITNSRTLESKEGRRFQAAARDYYPNRSALPEDDLAFIFWGIVHMWAEGLRLAGPNLTRDGWVEAMETLKGWNGGQFAPTKFGPGDRKGPDKTIVVKAIDGQWVTTDGRWRRRY